MIDKLIAPSPPPQDSHLSEKTLGHKALRGFREFLAVFFWLYATVKVFIFDLDVYLTNKYLPNVTWLLRYKFFILIGTIALIWVMTKSKHILLWALYIAFYPLILLAWKIPYLIFQQKSWILAFAVINSTISFFRSAKHIFIFSAFFLIAIVFIFHTSAKLLLWCSVIYLAVSLLIAYIYRFILVFKPSSVFQLYRAIFSGVRTKGIASFTLDASIKGLPIVQLDSTQLAKWTQNLQMSVLYNRTCLFITRKLRDYQNSGLNIITYVFTIVLLLIFTIFTFATINYGLYKIDNGIFLYSNPPGFFIFLYYSFENLLFNNIPEISPVTAVSQTASMLEGFFSLFLVVILVTLLLSVKTQRYTEELNGVIGEIEEQGNEMEEFIRREYQINSIQEAIAELEKVKAGLLNIIIKMSDGLK